MKGTLHEDQYTFFYHISPISSYNEKYFRQNQYVNGGNYKTHILYSLTVLFFLENRAFYEIM